jgi:hypothetical protein
MKNLWWMANNKWIVNEWYLNDKWMNYEWTKNEHLSNDKERLLWRTIKRKTFR